MCVRDSVRDYIAVLRFTSVKFPNLHYVIHII